ncbi:hypothetical protein VTK26DRAFT_1857 [Humicola hyalothermophila]
MLPLFLLLFFLYQHRDPVYWQRSGGEGPTKTKGIRCGSLTFRRQVSGLYSNPTKGRQVFRWASREGLGWRGHSFSPCIFWQATARQQEAYIKSGVWDWEFGLFSFLSFLFFFFFFFSFSCFEFPGEVFGKRMEGGQRFQEEGMGVGEELYGRKRTSEKRPRQV